MINSNYFTDNSSRPCSLQFGTKVSSETSGGVRSKLNENPVL